MYLAAALCSLALLFPAVLCESTDSVHCLTKLTTKKPKSVKTIHEQTTITKTATHGATKTVTLTSKSTPETTTTVFSTTTSTVVSSIGPKYTTNTIIEFETTTTTETSVSTSTVFSTSVVSTTTTTSTSTLSTPPGYTPVESTLPYSDYQGSNSKRDLPDAPDFAVSNNLAKRWSVEMPERDPDTKGYPEDVTCFTTHIQSTTVTTHHVSYTTVPAQTITKTKSGTTTTTQTAYVEDPTPRTTTLYNIQTSTITQQSTQTTTSTVLAVETETVVTGYYPACDPSRGGIIDHIGNYFVDAAFDGNAGPVYSSSSPTSAYECCSICLYDYQDPSGIVCKLGVWQSETAQNPPANTCFIVSGNVTATGNGVQVNNPDADPSRYLAVWNGVGYIWDDVQEYV